MKKVLLLLAVATLSPFLFSIVLYGQQVTMKLSVDSAGTMNGHSGFYESNSVNDTVNEIEFLFEENGYVRMYYFDNFQYQSSDTLPGTYYEVKSGPLAIGDSWDSWYGDSTRCLIVDTTTLTVPAGTFKTSVCNIYSKLVPDSLVGVFYFAYNVGWVKAIYMGGTGLLSSYSVASGGGNGPLSVGNWWQYEESVTAVNETEGKSKPSVFSLSQNYPNPFNPTTVIGYQLSVNSDVTLRVYDVLGRAVETLVHERQSAGEHSVRFNAANLPSGVYFYQLQSGTYSNTKKLLLLK